MIKLEAFIIAILYLFYRCDCGILPSSQMVEQTLITSLLNGYNKNIRPDNVVSVDITATIQQIVAIDEKQQVMTSSSFISQTWIDERLLWAPNVSNNNITVVMLPVKSLWIPDTMILNSADANGYLTINDNSMASVDNEGQVYMILPALTVRTRCSMTVRNFPFDRQMCPINLTSWSQGSNRIVYTENDSLVVDLSGYSEHPLWKLNRADMTVIRSEDRSPFEYTYNAVISVQLYIQRKPSFFIVNGIFACLILNCVTLLSFSLAFTTQIGLCMTCFMTYSVYSLSFSNLFPQQSDYIMMITLYFLLSICWTFISMAWFVICNYYISKGEMPKLLYEFCGRLQNICFCCFPPPKQDDKTKKNFIIENGQFNKSGEQESTKMKCVSCQKLFSSCLRRPIIDNNQVYSVENIESARTNPTETAASIIISMSEPISTKNSTNLKSRSIDQTNERAKPKCDFCDRCETCQADFDKDKAKNKSKKDIEARCNALNYLIFFCVLILIFVSNMALWLSMSK